MAYDRIDPIGGYRGDIQAAIVASTIANVNRGKGHKAFTINDFMPFMEDKGEEPVEIDNDGLSVPNQDSLKLAFDLLMKSAKKKEK